MMLLQPRRLVPGTVGQRVFTAASGFSVPFHENSVWNRPITDEPVHANSANMIAYLLANGGTDTNIDGISNRWSCPLYEAEPGTPTTRMYADDDPNKWIDLPLEATFYPSPDGDAKLMVKDPDTGYVWCAWGVYYGNVAPHGLQWYSGFGSFGGFIYDETGDGVTGHGQHPSGGGWGGRAGGSPYLGGIIFPEEMQAGAIEHKLALILPGQAVHPGTFLWPCRNGDGYADDTVNSIPYGSLMQLNPALDISGYSTAQQVIGNCLKTYGAWMVDTGDLVGLNALEFLTPDGLNVDSAPWSGLLTANDFPLAWLQHMRILTATQADYYIEA